MHTPTDQLTIRGKLDGIGRAATIYTPPEDLHDCPTCTGPTRTVVSSPCPTCGSFNRHAKPNYVYVASSWRNPMQPAVCAMLKVAGIEHYDFRNPEGGTRFSWREVKTDRPSVSGIATKGSDWEQVDEYLRMVAHPRAIDGFEADFAAMQRADAFVMVLPCGKSAHLELGWAIGAGKRTAILLEDPVEPELMYRCADYIAPNVFELLAWLGVED